jgi:hypothetical protein
LGSRYQPERVSVGFLQLVVLASASIRWQLSVWPQLVLIIFCLAEKLALRSARMLVLDAVAGVLKLRFSGLRKIQGAKTPGIIITRRVSFEVARFRIAVDQAGKNTGEYHNPTRQRGISRNTA